MDDVKLTRVRMEATGTDSGKVSLFLAEKAGEIKLKYGGEWEEEDPGVQLMGTADSDKTWGRLTIRRRHGT